MTTNPLVAQRVDSTQWYSGLGLAEDIADIAEGIESGTWVDITIGGVAASMDTLGLVLDPVGSLVSWGISWLMEHVKPLSDALDWLAGDPDQVIANAQTWKNVAAALTASAQEFRQAIARDVAEWSGESAQAYRFTGQDQFDAILSIGKGSAGIGSAVELSGLLVSFVRELVRDLIADFISVLAVRLPMWLAEVGLTVGIATPWVVGQVGALVGKWAARIAKVLKALINSFKKLAPLLKRLDELMQGLADALRRIMRRDSADPNRPRGPDQDGDGNPDFTDPDHIPPALRRDDPLPTREMNPHYQYETDPNDPRNPFRNFPPPNNAVERWDAATRESHRVVVGPDGLLRTSSGELFDTSTGGSVHSPGGRAIFVMDEHGNIYASNVQDVGRIHHSTLGSGQPVTGAGELQVRDGRLEVISDQSGHYRPGRSNTQQVLDELRRQGLNVDDGQVHYTAPPGS